MFRGWTLSFVSLVYPLGNSSRKIIADLLISQIFRVLFKVNVPTFRKHSRLLSFSDHTPTEGDGDANVVTFIYIFATR